MIRPRVALAFTFVVAVVASFSMSSPATADDPPNEALLGYYGDWLGRDQGIVDFTEPGTEPLVPWALQERFESWIGRPADLRLDFATTPEPGNPDSWAEVLISALELSGPCGHPSQPGGPGARRSVIGMPLTIDETTLAQVAAGVGPHLEDIDAIWRTIAESYVAAGMDDAIIRLAFEMDNPAIPWHAAADPTSFVAAWRRAVTVMRSVPGAAFEFSYDTLVSGYFGNPGRAEAYYPGDDVVDYIGIDVYDGVNSSYGDATARWSSFFGPRLDAAAAFAATRGKPVSIGEWGLSAGFANQARADGGGGDNAVFVTNMLDFIENNDVAYHIYFDRYGIYSQGPYRIMPYEDPAAVAASVAGVSWADVPSHLPGGATNPVTAQDLQFPAAAAIFETRLAPSVATTTTTVPGSNGPTITDQPSSARVDDGDTTSFAVSATGAGTLTYQWFVDGTAVPGATGSTYTLPALGLTPGCATVTVDVTDTNGTTTSDPAVVTARPVPPTIDTTPSIAIDGNGYFELTVTPSGSAPLEVRWFVDGVPVAGAPSPTLTLAEPADGSVIHAVVTNPGGTAATGSVTLVVPEEGPIPDPRRVTDGLASLWQFTDLAGSAVPDLFGSADLTIGNPTAATWLTGGGLEITGDADITSGTDVALSNAVRSATNFSVEMWVTPDVATPTGPGTVVSLADTAADRMMVSQGLYSSEPADDWWAGLASTSPSATTFRSSTNTTAAPAHIVFSRRGGRFGVLHVNGTIVGQREIPGALGSWGDLEVIIGEDVTGGRSWNGTVHLAAVYTRSLSDAEVALHHSIGLPVPRPGGPTTTTTAPTTTSSTTTTTAPTTTTTTTTAPTTTTTTTTAPTTTTVPVTVVSVAPPAPDQPGLTLTQVGNRLDVEASAVPGASLYQFRHRIDGGSWSWSSPQSSRSYVIDDLSTGDDVDLLARALVGASWRGWTSATTTIASTTTTTTNPTTTTTTGPTTTTSATTTTTGPTTTTSATTTTTGPTTTTAPVVTVPPPSSSQPGLTITLLPGALDIEATVVSGAPLYQFRYRVDGASWIWSTPQSTRTFAITDLTPGTEVDVLARALQGGAWRNWTSATVTVVDGTVTTTTAATSTSTTAAPTTTAGPTTTTGNQVITFPAPNPFQPGLIVTLSPGTLDIEATPVNGATLYQFRYQVDGGSTVWFSPQSSRMLSLTGLDAGADVTILARALIGSSWQNWTGRTVTVVGP